MDNQVTKVEEEEDFPTFLTILFANGVRQEDGSFLVNPQAVSRWERRLNAERFIPFD